MFPMRGKCCEKPDRSVPIQREMITIGAVLLISPLEDGDEHRFNWEDNL